VVFHDAAPAEVDPGGNRHWYARGQNFVVGYTDCAGSMTARRAGQPDEWMLLLPGSDTSARISAGGEVAHTAGYSLAVMPPGDSEVEITGTGQVVRIFSAQAGDLLALAINAGSYARDHLNVAPWAPWPPAESGPRIRIYSLDVPRVDGRLGRIWRCSTLMVNLSWPYEGPRDESKLSPHSHPDFEQGSLVVAGEYIHHIRWPWTSDRRAWREDEHVVCGSPSVTIIPPPTVHTSRGQGAGTNHLIDIFAPPRRDFSERPGWLLNADEYPMPPP
jgi:mannose-6-phosphate isomerase-like protein (cupin superfamily)